MNSPTATANDPGAFPAGPADSPPPAWDADVERYLRHEFNILGSGWIRAHYGLQAPGFLGKNYSDPGMTWERLLGGMTSPMQERARKLMALAKVLRPGYEPIDWHVDLKTGFRSELRPGQEIAYGKTEGVDLKVTGDMSRCYALPQLAVAWQETGKTCYRDEALAQMLDWLAANPAGIGPGWRANMNVAIRAVNWVTALDLLFGEAGPTEPAHREAAEYLEATLPDHLHHIAANLEFSETQYHPNHYVANLVGLVTVALRLGGKEPSAKGWERLAWREMRMEIKRRVASDGVDFEASTAYHAFVLEMFTVALLLCARARGKHLAAEQRAWIEQGLGKEGLAELRRMFVALEALTAPNGLIPLIGDSDSGRLIHLETPKADPRDWRFLSCIGAALFGDASLLPEGCQPRHWTSARRLVMDTTPLAGERVRQDAAFSTTGFYVLRGGDAWSLVCAGPVGTAGLGGHDHNDRLALTLAIGEYEFLVDPGVFVYTASVRERNACRSVLTHNTLAIDGQEPNRWLDDSPWWGCREDAHCRCVEWNPRPDQTVFVGEHRGYARFTPPLVHRRRIELLKLRRQLTIEDDVVTTASQPIPDSLWTFVLHPACLVRIAGGEAQIARNGKEIRFMATPGIWTVEETTFSPAYGIRDKTKVLKLRHNPGIARQTFAISW